MTRWAVFLDDGGVMNDNEVRAAQWQRALGAFFAPRLGGKPEAWGAANYGVMMELLAPAAWHARLAAAPDYATFDRAYQLDWLRMMCARVEVAMPPEATVLALTREAATSIVQRVQSAFPGAVDAIRALHAAGYPLYTASGESSADLAGYLTAMGVRDCFRRLYGPDLIETFKTSPAFYTRLLADAGVDAAAALVVDDNFHVLDWAAEAGARTVLIGLTPPPAPHRHLPTLAGLPALLAEWE